MSTITAEDVSRWVDGNTVDGLPVPPDRYHPGHLAWGSNPARGRAIQRARGAKQVARNREAMLAILPTLTPASTQDALNIARVLGDDTYAVHHGWQYWQKDNRASWIHESDAENISKARDLGATMTKGKL